MFFAGMGEQQTLCYSAILAYEIGAADVWLCCLAIFAQQEYAVGVKKSANAIVFIGAAGNEQATIGISGCCPTYR